MKISERFKSGKTKSWQGFRPLFKRVLASFAAVALVCSAVSFMSFADVGDEFTQDELTYTVLSEDDDNNTVSVKAANKSIEGEIEIPEMVTNNGIEYTVTTIGKQAFNVCTELTEVTIPGSVTAIGENAFYKCTSLTEVTIPDSVISIDKGAFASCESLTSIEISNSLTSIDDYTFAGCESLTKVTIPDSVTSIGDFAFSDCISLTEVTIGALVTEIGEDSFVACVSLTLIKIPTDFDKNKFGNSGVVVGNDENKYTIVETYPVTNGEFEYYE